MRPDQRFIGRYDSGREEWGKESRQSIGKNIEIDPHRFESVED
jgi:hypothetical protein